MSAARFWSRQISRIDVGGPSVRMRTSAGRGRGHRRKQGRLARFVAGDTGAVRALRRQRLLQLQRFEDGEAPAEGFERAQGRAQLAPFLGDERVQEPDRGAQARERFGDVGPEMGEG